MKLAWFVFDDENGTVQFFTTAPDCYSDRLVQIVYAEVAK